MWLIILITVVTLLLYFSWIKPLLHWAKRGIPYLKPLPLVGNMGPIVAQRQALAHLTEDIYNSHPDKRYVGCHQFLLPTLMIRDPGLIKKMVVTDFTYFSDHRDLVPEGVDPLWGKGLFALKGDRWHSMRATLSPTFTSSKMKMMFGLMRQCALNLTSHFQNQDGMAIVEMKDTFTRFTNDVIATTAFGVTCDSLGNPENEFYSMGKKAFNFTGLSALILFLNALNPWITKLLNVPILSKSVSTFFRGIIKENMALRQQNGVVRPDMLHLLMEAKKGRLSNDEQNGPVLDSGFAVAKESTYKESKPIKKVEITDEDIIAQALVFFGAGFDTASTLMCFVAYELAVNPYVQQKLVAELHEALERCEGQLTYEILLEMKYLDMVVSEALRKWSPAVAGDRKTLKSYTIEPELPNEEPLTIEPGTAIWLPYYAIQRDPKYYPNPEKFDPERFSDANKHNIKPFTYLPFGRGPRSCIGSRFALLETKLITAETLSKFEIVPVEKTEIPLKLAKGCVFPASKNGLWLGFKRRVNSI